MCTDRGDDPGVPPQHHVHVLHHAQQVEEAAAVEETEEGYREVGQIRQNQRRTSDLLINALLVGVSQQPPVLAHFYQLVDFVAQLQIFTVQTLGRKTQAAEHLG